jgi:hypothetical protein
MPNKRITDLPESNYVSSSNYYLIYDPTATLDQNADGYVDFNKKITYTNVCTQFSQSAITWFGTGADKALNTTSSLTYTTTADQEVLVKNYTSLTVNSGHTITVSQRCKCLLLYVGGNCTINGTLTMTGLGAKSTGSIAHYVYQSKNYHGNFIPHYSFNSVKLYPSGSGGGGISSNGLSAGYGYTGGGGGGFNGNRGGSGTSWSGGAGGGAGPAATVGSNYGGTGGVATTANCGGGAGNPGGTAGPGGGIGGTGTGGVIILVVKGTFTLGSTGVISANGSNGGSGTAGGGGGSGGGRIVILYGQQYVNSGGTISVNGGTGGGTSPSKGGDGGAGSITIRQIGVL